MKIPPRQEVFDDKDRRFYVMTPTSVYLELQKESVARGTDVWTLGGSVLSAWLAAGCPSFASDTTTKSEIPPSSSSLLADEKGHGA